MISWVLPSSILIVVLIGLRRLLKGKISLRLQYALWGLVLLRLLVPFSFGGSRLSVMNTAEKIPAVQVMDRVKDIGSIGQTEVGGGEGSVSQGPTSDPSIDVAGEAFARMERTVALRHLLIPVWLCGSAIFFVVFTAFNVSFALRLRRTRKPLEVHGAALAVYVTGETETPCLFGLLRPAIYVTPEAARDATVLRHTVEHETTHFRHGDHLWSLLRGVCLALHWYNPLVWWVAVLSRDDGELACDEGTIRRIGEGERTEYGRTLIAMTCRSRAAFLISATTMTGGKKSVKERIALLAARPKMAMYTLAAVVLIAAAAVIFTFTGSTRVSIRVDAQVDAPDVVLEYAKDYVRRTVEQYDWLGANPPDMSKPYRITRAKITGLTQMNTGTAELNNSVNLYRLEYRLRPDHPERVVLAGGRTIEDGWITEWDSTGQPYFLMSCDDSGPQPVWQLICITSTDAITTYYGTPEMLRQYGNPYTAAAMELYYDYLKGATVSRFNRLDVVTAMREVKAGDLLHVESGTVTAAQLAPALNAAASRQIGEAEANAKGYTPGKDDYWRIWGAYLEGEPDSFSSDNLHFMLSCGLAENVVEVSLRKKDRPTDTAYFEDEALYQLVRHSSDYEEVVDQKAYEKFRDVLVPQMQATYEAMSHDVGEFTGYQLTRFTLAWSYTNRSDGSTVELYDFDYALLTDHPTEVGWAGGMYLDSKLRIQGMNGGGQLAVKYSGGKVVSTVFMGNDFHYSSAYSEDETWAMEHINGTLNRAAVKGTPLSSARLAQVKEAFAPILTDARGTETVNPISCFFTSYYASPADINLYQFLYQYPNGSRVTDQAEFEALKKLSEWPFGQDTTLEQMPVPIHKYTAKALNETLLKYAGITRDDLSGVGFDEVLYLKEYDAYYNFTSDFGPGMFNCVRGELEGDTVRLYSEYGDGGGSTLTLRKEGGSYLIVSHLKTVAG